MGLSPSPKASVCVDKHVARKATRRAIMGAEALSEEISIAYSPLYPCPIRIYTENYCKCTDVKERL